MKITMQAVLNLMTKGTSKATTEVKDISKELDNSADNAERMNRALAKTKIGKRGMAAAGIEDPDHGPGGTSTAGYRTSRSAGGSRGAAARNFSGLVNTQNETGGFVAAYATLAANLFAVTAGFKALSDAAKVEQLTQGLELMGARSGVALKSTAKNLQLVTDNAISTADAMRAVAQASSAGLSSTEIERLGGVARGASLALGRDMSDSLDRLTRGAIKLEPELLDELGIMVRLDEAVKTYAEKNNIAASALTLTQRRQAFLNSVLEEGEKKFSAINNQIEANPYDQLSASVRDMGTDILKVVNEKIRPLIEVLTEIPQLGLVIALGVLNQTFNKVLPNLEKFERAQQGQIQGQFKKFQHINEDLMPEARMQLAIADTDSDRASAQREVNRLKARENAIVLRTDMLAKQLLITQNFRETSAKKGVILATIEAAEAQKNLLIQQAILGVKSKINLIDMGKNLFAGMSTALNFALGGLGAIFTVLTLVATALAVAKALWNYFYPPTEAQKELKKYKDVMDDLLETAKKTREQVASMTVGEGFDALTNTSLELLNNLEAQLRVKERIGKETSNEVQSYKALKAAEAAKNSASMKFGIDPTAEKRLAFEIADAKYRGLKADGLAEKTFKKLSESTQIILTNIQDTNPELYSALESALRRGASEDEVLKILISQKKELELQRNLNKDLTSSVDLIKKGWNDLRLKDLKTDLTDVNAGFQNMDLRIAQLTSRDIITGLPTAELAQKEAATFVEQFQTMGTDSIRGLLSGANAIGVEIDPKDEEAVRNLIKDLDTVKNLKIDIEIKGWSMEKDAAIVAAQQRAEKGVAVGVMALNNITAASEETLQALKVAEKTQANISKYNSIVLEIEKENLKVARDRRDTMKDTLGITSSEISKVKDLYKLADGLADIDRARREETDKIADISARLAIDTKTLRLQKAQAEGVKGKPVDQVLVKYLDDQITATENLAEVEKRRARQQTTIAIQQNSIIADKLSFQFEANTLAKSEVSLLGGAVDQTGLLVSAENIRLTNLKKANDFLKEQGNLISANATTQLNNERALAEANAARRGTTLDVASQRAFEKKGLENKRDDILRAQENATKAKDTALAKADLDFEVFKVEMAGAQLALQNSIAEADLIASKGGRRSDTTSAAATLAGIPGFIETMKTNHDTEKSNIEALALLKQEGYDKELAGVQILIDGIVTSSSDALNRIQNSFIDKMRGATAAFGLTGQAKDTFLAERQGILNDPNKTTAQKEEEISLIKKQSFALQEQQIITEGLSSIFDNMGDSMSNAFIDVINGTKSAGKAFGEMALQIVKDIQMMIVKLLVFKAIEAGLNALFPGTGAGSLFTSFLGGKEKGGTVKLANGGVIGLANGGIMDASGGLQGIVSKPTYLVGEGRHNEAVVPLPNGRSIPVQMHGGGNSQSNNVAVTVNMTNNGSQTQTEGPDANKMGSLIAAAVQRELVAQKAPGGLLNRYSAS